MPIVIAIGADPATMLAAAMPIPDGVSELAFAGLLRRKRPASPRQRAWIWLFLPMPSLSWRVPCRVTNARTRALWRPYGPLQRRRAIPCHHPQRDHASARSDLSFDLHRTSAGRTGSSRRGIGRSVCPAGAPAVPEVRDVYFPVRGLLLPLRRGGHRQTLSWAGAVASCWDCGQMLPQFMMTKTIVVVDADDIDIRNWDDVLWAISTRFDASRESGCSSRTRRSTISTSPRRCPAWEARSDSTQPERLAPRRPAHGGKLLKMSHEDRDTRR